MMLLLIKLLICLSHSASPSLLHFLPTRCPLTLSQSPHSHIQPAISPFPSSPSHLTFSCPLTHLLTISSQPSSTHTGSFPLVLCQFVKVALYFCFQDTRTWIWTLPSPCTLTRLSTCLAACKSVHNFTVAINQWIISVCLHCIYLYLGPIPIVSLTVPMLFLALSSLSYLFSTACLLLAFSPPQLTDY